MGKFIPRFRGLYRFLSNFFEVQIEYEGIVYPSVEHAYQAAKTMNVEAKKAIAEFSTPGKAKRYGACVALRPGWEKMKIDIMRELLRLKFNHSGLKEMLLATEGDLLVEGNKWHDQFWGHCQCEACSKFTGLNVLGGLLMELRTELRNK